MSLRFVSLDNEYTMRSEQVVALPVIDAATAVYQNVSIRPTQ
jgi:hypothetical protein